MKSLRLTLSVLTLFFLGLGYAGSQYAALGSAEAAQNWAQRADSKPIVTLSLVLFVAAILLSFFRDREERS